MKKKMVLVTGAGGFIGSNLTEELLSNGYKVRALLRKREPLKNISSLLENKNFEIIRGDLLDKESLKKAINHVEIVFHLAAKSDLSAKTYRPYYLHNEVGTKNLVDVCGKNIKKFVYFSSILAVGLPDTKKLLDENYVGEPSSYYGKSKKNVEEFLLKKHKENNFPVVILRPSTVYGPRELAVQYLLFKVIKEGKFLMIGSGENLMSYVYVKNVIDGATQAMNTEKTSGKIYFINDKRPYRFREVVNTISKTTGKSTILPSAPYVLAFYGSMIYEKICKLLGLKPLIYPSRVRTMILNYAYSIKKATAEFGYNPKYSLSEGIRETYNWYRENGYL